MQIGSNVSLCLLNCLKAAIILEWVRLFVPRGTRNWFYWTGYLLLFIHACLFVSIVVSLNMICIPYKKNWDFTTQGRCLHRGLIDMAYASVQLLTDIFTFVLPRKIIWSLKLSRKKQRGVSFVFAVGVL